MKPKNHYNDKNLKEKFEKSQEKFENIEEKGNKRGRFNFDKIKGFLGTLKSQGIKVGGILVDFFFLSLEKSVKLFKKVWSSEGNTYKMYLAYRKIILELSDKFFRGYSKARSLEEKEDWKEKADILSLEKYTLPTIPFSCFMYMVGFAFKSSFYIKRQKIINILTLVLIFISLMLNVNNKITFFIFDLNFLILFYVAFLTITYFSNYKRVADLVDGNDDYYNDIWNIALEGYNNIIRLQNSKKNPTKQLQSPQQEFYQQQPTVQQQPRQEDVYNPYADMWKEINAKYFKLDDFKIPEYEKLELIERHIIHDYDLKEEDVVKISENIEKYRGIPINIIKSKDGKIVVDFLIGKFPNLIPFNEVPKVDENFIVVGKSAEGWVTWNLKTAPHGLIVGATGSGKSNTVRFVFNEFQKKDEYFMYVIDFKGGSDYYFLDGKYDLITDTEEFIDFIKKLGSELAYRQKLFKDLRSSEINNVNHLLIKKGKNIIPNLMIFMDEFAFVSSLPKDVKSFIIKNIEQLMQRGRSFGIHFTLIVQQPTAENLGSSYIRSLIGFRLIGKLEDEADYEKSFGASNNLKGQDKSFANKMKNEADFLGKFIVKGGHMENKPLGRNVIVRIPFMDVGDYNEMVLNEWEDNPHADYQLHYDDEENDEVLNKIYGKDTENIVEADYEVIDEDEDDDTEIYSVEDLLG